MRTTRKRAVASGKEGEQIGAAWQGIENPMEPAPLPEKRGIGF